MMRLPRTLLMPTAAALLVAGYASAAYAELRLGVVAPTDGLFATLGEQVRAGVRAFASTEAGKNIVVEAISEDCDEEGAAAMARRLSPSRRLELDAVIGFLCPDSLRAAMPVLAEAGIPVITVAVRSPILMEDALKEGWPLFRLAPHADEEARKAAAAIIDRWRGEPLALVDDGTIYGRDLVEAIRLRIEEIGMESIFIDNYRPAQEKQFGLARRLRKAGATHVFIGGDRADIGVIARDATELGYPLTIMGGDALRGPDGPAPLPDGTLAIVMPEPAELDSAEAAVEALETIDAPTDGYAVPAFTAAQILSAAAAQSEQGGASMEDILEIATFSTALGPIQFGRDHERDGNGFRLMVWRNGEFEPVETAGSGAAPDAAPAGN